MAQLNFQQNFPFLVNVYQLINDASLTFFPFNIYDSISFNCLNCVIFGSNANKTQTYSIGLYSLNASTLSLENSMSATLTQNNASRYYLSITATSATENITPGTWYLGFLVSTGGNSNFSIMGQTNVNPANAFPSAFIGGRMTVSTNALPTAYSTSDLDITGNDAMWVPTIILSA